MKKEKERGERVKKKKGQEEEPIVKNKYDSYTDV